MKSFSKRVASFAMAAAMVCSLAVVSPVDAEAASTPAFEKTRSAITAGTNYTYAVKNVTSKQYVKVYATTGIAVKYNNAKVTKGKTEIKGGKTIKVKINANEKVANYKGKVTVKVFNKKTNKKVKDLSDSFTVKCTKLAVTSVEPATMTSATNKYIVVNFNKALSSLDPSEVIIRKKSTNELVAVEKVALASNGKSATLTLLGDSSSYTNFLQANTDYVLTVEKSGATASMDFNFPDVKADVVVSATDASKRTITIGAIKYTVPTTISVDFQEILGRTVTFWFNQNNEISKLVVANETVVYGAFGSKLDATTGVYTLSSKTTGDKYTTVPTMTAGSTIYATTKISPVGKTPDVLPNIDTSYIDYAKLVLNPNGTVRSITYIDKLPTKVLVASVAGNVITESKTVAANLKDYTIVKDGKTIAITDIQAGDVVFCYTADKFAEVFTNKVTGVVTYATDSKITIAGTTYEYTTASYIDGNETKTANGKYFAALKSAGKDAVVYLDRTGKIVYASGDQGAVATTTREVIVKGNTQTYTLGLESYIKLNASDATDVAVPEIKLSNLKTVKVGGTTYTKDDTTGVGIVNLKSFDVFDDTDNDKVLDQIIATKKNSADNAKDQAITISPVAGNVVTLTVDSADANKVVGIEVSTPTDSVSTNAAFEKGKTVIDGQIANAKYQLVSSTPVFEITKDGASVTKTTYGEYSKKTKETKNGQIKLYVANGNNVTKVVIDNSNDQVYDVTDTADVIGIVTARDLLDSKLISLTIVSEGAEKVFTNFADTANSDRAVASLVKVTYDKATNKVTAINNETLSTITDAKTFIKNGKIEVNDTTKYEFATSKTPSIFVKENGGLRAIAYNELSDLAVTAIDNSKSLEINYHEMVTGIIDYAVVEVK